MARIGLRGRRSIRRLSGLGGKSDGMAAVEFALILPIALMILSLVMYGGQAYSLQRKVTLAASTVASLVAQANNVNAAKITTAQLNQILAYPSLILYPNDTSGIQVVVSQLQVTAANGVATGAVVNSWPNANTTARPIGQTMPIDSSVASALAPAGSSCSTKVQCYVILGEVRYPFQPLQIYVSLGALTLQDSAIMIPRTAAKIAVGS